MAFRGVGNDLRAFDEQARLIGVVVLAASSKLPEYLLRSAERLDTEGE